MKSIGIYIQTGLPRLGIVDESHRVPLIPINSEKFTSKDEGQALQREKTNCRLLKPSLHPQKKWLDI